MVRRSSRPMGLLSIAIVLAATGSAGLRSAGTQEATPPSHAPHQDRDQATPDAGRSPYADDFATGAPIRSLRPEQIEQIRRGDGAGYALPAELNGLPGPRHALDLGDDLGLSPDQRARVRGVLDRMRAAAIPAGERYLAALQVLEDGFRTGAITEAELPERVAEVSRLQGELVAVHLAAHLQTAAALTPEQITAYARLRGYR